MATCTVNTDEDSPAKSDQDFSVCVKKDAEDTSEMFNESGLRTGSCESHENHRINLSSNCFECNTENDKTCACPRNLTQDEREKLRRDTRVLSEFKQQKLEMDAHKNWDRFYKRNTTKFFKDRHWTKREFQELCGDHAAANEGEKKKPILLEVGCGVGNLIFPLLEEDTSMFIHACDFSPRAVEFVKEHPLFDGSSCNVFVCDVVKSQLTDNIPANSVDIASLIFVLSSIHPEKMETALQNIYQVLRPGGLLLFRDYGLYDYAMLRFAPGHKLGENFYVRQDGTRAYYFTTEELTDLVTRTGFKVISNYYVKRETVNKKERLCVPRIFIQGKFVKAPSEQLNCTNT